ncbi:MAG TPA: SAF domain-containing protein [Propionibacteriaceae bacterium]|nr:SAF domain-containing protein [Propionibacteriaceae bacterium]
MTVDIEPRTAASSSKARKRKVSPPAESAVTPQPPRLPGRRNPKWIALGIVALCLGGLLSYVIYARVASETAVVAAAHTVYRGETIERGDLATITLRSGSLPNAIPVRQLNDLVGKRAAFDLVEGSVILSTAVTDAAIPAEGRTIVGVKLAPGRSPGNLLQPASRVRLIAMPAATDSSTTDKLAGSIFVGSVIDQSPAADGTSILVNVDVDASAAPTIAMLAAQDRIAIVRDAGR